MLPRLFYHLLELILLSNPCGDALDCFRIRWDPECCELVFDHR